MPENETIVEKQEVEKLTEEKIEEVKKVEKEEPEQIDIEVDVKTAFQMRLLEFDKVIGEAKKKVAELESKKSSFIYDHNVQMLTEEHKAKLIENQIKEETRRKLQQNKK